MPNYFYDLPEELQEMIYKKMWVNVMQELVSLKEIADTYEMPLGYGGLTFHSIQTFYKYPAIAQLTLKNAVNNIKVMQTRCLGRSLSFTPLSFAVGLPFTTLITPLARSFRDVLEVRQIRAHLRRLGSEERGRLLLF